MWVVVSVPTPARPGRSFSPLERPGSTRWFVPDAANASESAEPEPSASKKEVSPEDHRKSVFSEDSRARVIDLFHGHSAPPVETLLRPSFLG